MIEEKTNIFKYRNMIRESKNFIYKDPVTNMAYKLDKDAANDMLEHYRVFVTSSKIDKDQIEWLNNTSRYISKSYLPCGVLNYGISPVAIIYPKYFDGYKTFEELYREDNLTIFKNLRQALLNNRELLNNGIYNTDFSFKNILYKGNEVELVDLDGKHLKKKEYSNYNQVYMYYLHDLKKLVWKKLPYIYGSDTDKVYAEIQKMLDLPVETVDIDYPFDLLDKVEKRLVLK